MRRGEVDQAAVERVERELAEAEASLAERERQHDALLAEVAADIALGVASTGDAATKTRPSEQALDLARAHVEQLRRAVSELQQRLAAREQREREAQARAAAEALSRACGKVNDVATKLAKSLAESDRLARDLLARRADVDVAAKSGRCRGRRFATSSRAASSESCSGGTGRTPDGWLDEVDFLAGLEVLRDVLQGGARRPQHEAEAEAERKQAEREGQEREVAAWVRLHPQRAPEVLARDDLSPERRAEIEQILAEARLAASARATAAAEREREEQRERAEEEALA